MMDNNHLLISCGDHKLAPWSIVCVHLMNQMSKDWVPIKSNHPEVDFDWVCTECAKTISNPDIENLRCVCIHCTQQLRKSFDANFTE